MNHQITNKRDIGINFHPDINPTAKVWAPHAKKMQLEIHNKKPVCLKRENFGFWHASCPDLVPGDKYKIRINGKDCYPDPASLSQPTGVHDYSEALDLNQISTIKDKNWKGIPQEKLIIYELHTGTFTPEGTLEALSKKLQHLKTLGVNAIKIMPVATFPGNRNWGYDGVYPFAVHHAYGGAKKLAELVKTCHQKGFAVILDVVYNHLGPEGNYLNAFGPYFTKKYKTPWGDAVNFDDAWCDGVRDYFLENAMMWLRDFHIDGLRLDAVHAIKDFGPKHFLKELSDNVEKLNRQTGFDHFLIAECDLNDTRYIKPPEECGYGLHAQWCDEWHHALHALITGEKRGYYSDFGEIRHLAKSFRHAYVYDGIFSQNRKKIFGTSTAEIPGSKFVIFSQNHDQVGNRMKGERLTQLTDFETLKLTAAATLFSPFIPMLFMGEEFAEDNPFLYFISHTDENLVEKVRKGRKKEFRAFIEDAQPPDPFDRETFLKSKLKWNFTEDSKKQNMFEYYQKCIEIRKENPLINSCNRNNLLVRESESGNIIILLYNAGKESLSVILNFSENPVSDNIEEAANFKTETLLYSAHKKWGGEINNNGKPLITSKNMTQINMAPRSAALTSNTLI